MLANSLFELVFSNEIHELLVEVGELNCLLTTLLIVEHEFKTPVLHESKTN